MEASRGLVASDLMEGLGRKCHHATIPCWARTAIGAHPAASSLVMPPLPLELGMRHMLCSLPCTLMGIVPPSEKGRLQRMLHCHPVVPTLVLGSKE